MDEDTNIVVRSLPCKLNDEELAKYRDELAACTTGVVNLKGEKKDSDAEYNEQIGSLSDRAIMVARMIEDRAEKRPVECDVVMDSVNGRVAYVRIDTEDVAEVRNMTHQEEQMVLGQEYVPTKKLTKMMDQFEKEVAEAEAKLLEEETDVEDEDKDPDDEVPT